MDCSLPGSSVHWTFQARVLEWVGIAFSRTTILSSNSNSAIFPKTIKTLTRTYICIPMFTLALFTIAKIWKQPKSPSIDEWIKQM